MTQRTLKVAMGLLVTVALLTAHTFAAEPEKKKEKKPKSDPNKENIFKENPSYTAQQEKARNIAAEIDAEVAARAVPVPPEMALDVEWYSPHVNAAASGHLIKGWIMEDLVLLETDRNNLIAVNRGNGSERWRCELTGPIRYAPGISRNNVIVNVNNELIAVERTGGQIRWRMMPSFVMSCAPLIVDPAAYPREYTNKWHNLETIYAGSWDARLQSTTVRGRMSYFIKKVIQEDNFAAPEFDLLNAWHRTHRTRGSITTPITLSDNVLYYCADDQRVYSVTRENTEANSYEMLGIPSTPLTVTPNTTTMNGTVYVGSQDANVYALDRLTLKKKWAFSPGYPAVGSIMADDYASPYLYLTTNDGLFHALKIQLPRAATKTTPEVLESYVTAWEFKGGVGAITAGPDIVYVGLATEKDFPGYKGVVALNKESGKVLWKSEADFFTKFIEYHNWWTEPTMAMRLYAMTSDNRLVSLKERTRETGVRVIKEPVKVKEPKVPGKKGEEPTPPEKAPEGDKKEDAKEEKK